MFQKFIYNMDASVLYITETNIFRKRLNVIEDDYILTSECLVAELSNTNLSRIELDIKSNSIIRIC